MNTDQKIIKNKVGLLNLSEVLGSVSEACKVMGYSRDSFYRFKELYEKGGELALKEISRRQPLLKNRVEPQVEQAVLEMAIEQPAFGQVRVANELTRRGTFISPSGVRSVWLRNDLHTFQRRLKALEAKLSQEPGRVLTESQVRAMEKAKEEKQAHGEIETAHPGYLGPGYLLCMNDQGRGTYLSANVHRYVCQDRFRQTVRSQECVGGGGYAERPRASLL
jgi:hypothetical protein